MNPSQTPTKQENKAEGSCGNGLDPYVMGEITQAPGPYRGKESEMLADCGPVSAGERPRGCAGRLAGVRTPPPPPGTRVGFQVLGSWWDSRVGVGRQGQGSRELIRVLNVPFGSFVPECVGSDSGCATA